MTNLLSLTEDLSKLPDEVLLERINEIRKHRTHRESSKAPGKKKKKRVVDAGELLNELDALLVGLDLELGEEEDK